MAPIKTKKSLFTSGFTIVEVLIVLAISALIMVIVFYAVPQAQSSRRDVQRKDYVRRVYEAQLEFLKNNGKIPTCVDVDIGGSFVRQCGNARQEAERFMAKYMPQDKDPSSGEPYVTGAASSGSTSAFSGNTTYHFNSSAVDHAKVPELGHIIIGTGHWCYGSRPDGGPGTNTTASTNLTGFHPGRDNGKFFILVGVERGKHYCLDNFVEL